MEVKQYNREKWHWGNFCKMTGCNIQRIEVDDLTVSFLFADDGCCDMRGAIELAKIIVPDCNLILTANADGEDTSYVLFAGEWVASEPKESSNG